MQTFDRRTLLAFFLVIAARPGAQAQPTAGLVPRFAPETSGLVLERPTQEGAFFDVLGRRAAVFGYENQPFEVWTYPLKILSDFQLSFQIQDYPGAFSGLETMAHIDVRPEATTLTYRHAAFTVRQTIFAPVDEMGVVMLLDVDSVRPLTITASFRPDLALMWPAGLMTGNLGWDAERRVYTLNEESRRFVGLVGAPGAVDVSVMPYQEEPRDVPNRFVLETTPEVTKDYLIPVVVAGSVTGADDARATYERLLGTAETLYRENARYYRTLQEETLHLTTPDERLNAAFAWAKAGTDKGLATNPMLGTGFVAGFRTSGNSERPGFAWFFGRDALWTAFALIAYGDFAAARTALDFLKQFQRDDGKIPHEVSQSAALLDWFDRYPYPWASADATPLYLIVHADYWRASGDLAFIRANWDSLKRAYRFTAATDTDGNHLIENTKVGHGWVEGGELYPAHEEIYMQGLWIEATRCLAELAEALGDESLAAEARAAAEATRRATEEVYWLAEAGRYAFSSATRSERFYRQDTVLPAVPMWWRTLDDDRAQQEVDHLGSGALATDWGARILSDRSDLYDPLSYHYGSVWPLFTGWAAMAAYRYDRPHVGYQALMANALLTFQDALGYVTELLSGDFNTAFGRSSHHQVWSEAMVVTPTVRGLLGLEASDGGRILRFAPQAPADWDRIEVRSVRVGAARFDLTYTRETGRDRVMIERRDPAADGAGVARIEVAPAFPLDAVVRAVEVNGNPATFDVTRRGDVQRALVSIETPGPRTDVVFTFDPGTEVYVRQEEAAPGARNQGLRILRSRAEEGVLTLLVEGRGGRTYALRARTPHRLSGAEGVSIMQEAGRDATVEITFEGPPDAYARRTVRLPLE